MNTNHWTLMMMTRRRPPSILDPEDDENENDLYRRRYGDQHPWGLDRVLTTIATLLSILALIFGLGINYQRLSALESQVNDFQRSANGTFVRRDVSAEQFDSIQWQLQQLRMQVDELGAIIMRQEERRRSGNDVR